MELSISKTVTIEGQTHRLYGPRADVVEAFLRRNQLGLARIALHAPWKGIQGFAGLLKIAGDKLG